MVALSKIKIAIWNANGLTRHELELKTFILDKAIDIMLISETHATHKTFVNIPNYNIHYTNHPDNKAHGGTAIIIKKTIKYHELDGYRKNNIQATTVSINSSNGPITISAVYCPPKFNNTKDQYLEYLNGLGSRYIAGGDYNAKNSIWGSRLTTSKGRKLLDAIRENNGHFISTGEPTYWPTDIRKQPDLIDLCIVKNIPQSHITIKSCLELSSDHSPLLMTILGSLHQQTFRGLYNNKTDWNYFRQSVEAQLTINISLKTENEIDSAIAFFNDSIIKALTLSTPNIKIQQKESIPIHIKQKIQQKRKLRKKWQITKHPEDKAKLNKSTTELKTLLKQHQDKKLEHYIHNLGATAVNNYSLWKATKNLVKAVPHKPPIKTHHGTWAKTNKEKANTLAEHFKTIFSNEKDNQHIEQNVNTSNPEKRMKMTTSAEIRYHLKNLNSKKAPGFDLINGKILKELPDVAITYIRQIFNSILRTQCFPRLWKVAQITAIPKPGKSASEMTSYRPISLLPILSKVFEKILFARLDKILIEKNIIPSHQFGFRRQHSTVQQVHRVINKILNDMENKRFCIAVYLDIAKAFDRVWHKGLLHKLSQILPRNHFTILKSYLENRHFFIKFEDECSSMMQMTAGVPQGSVLGPLLYLIFTADIPIPTTKNCMIATFADDTVLMASDKIEKNATDILQQTINNTVSWFDNWGIEVNKDKTVQVIYTNRKPKKHKLTIKNNEIKILPSAKYLGITIDEKLNWKRHIQNKRNEIKNKFRQLYWLLAKNSKLSLNNKVVIYKSIISPIWKYGIEIWGTAKKTNIKIIQRTQSKILRTITKAGWYIPNDVIHSDLNIDTIDDTIRKYSIKHIQRLTNHQNEQMRKLPQSEKAGKRRLKRLTPTELTI